MGAHHHERVHVDAMRRGDLGEQVPVESMVIGIDAGSTGSVNLAINRLGPYAAMSEFSKSREFYDFFRRQFSFLETEAVGSVDSKLMDTYFEATFSRGYPWMRQCGFANVFLKFTLVWDPRDQLFMFNVAKNRDIDIVGEDMSIMETFRFDEILCSLEPGWRSPHGEVDIWDGSEFVRRYAAATRPHARELFIPRVRPSVGFEGFIWRRAVSPVPRQGVFANS